MTNKSLNNVTLRRISILDALWQPENLSLGICLRAFTCDGVKSIENPSFFFTFLIALRFTAKFVSKCFSYYFIIESFSHFYAQKRAVS